MINNQNLNLNLKQSIMNPQTLERLQNNDSTLTSLNLRNNPIGDIGIRNLMETLKHNKFLTNLYLVSNSLGSEGILCLADTLRQNTSLIVLSLWSNIGDECAHLLANALIQNKSLKTLDLEHN